MVMVTHKLSLSTMEMDDYSDLSPGLRPRNITQDPPFLTLTPVPQEPNCRICLDVCPNILYCRCKGSFMVHEECLKLYLCRKSGAKSFKSKCEICNSEYELIVSKSCSLSCTKAKSRFQESTLGIILFFVFIALVVVYLGYCTYLKLSGKLEQSTQLTLLMVGVMLVLIKMGVLAVWLWRHLLVFSLRLDKIQPKMRTRSVTHTIPNWRQINDTVEYL